VAALGINSAGKIRRYFNRSKVDLFCKLPGLFGIFGHVNVTLSQPHPQIVATIRIWLMKAADLFGFGASQAKILLTTVQL
jgi:hypothetical protein